MSGNGQGNEHGDGQGSEGGSGTEGAQERPETPEVAPQLALVEFRRIFSSFPLFGGGGDGNLGKTSFEGHRLNDMIDLVEGGVPEDLVDAGDALWRAGGSMREAADELDGHIGRVEWEGESGDAFRDWGKRLVANSRNLATYAEGSGTQIKVAGEGLKTVKSSMPPRDTRVVQQDVKDIPAPKRVEGNKDYDEAVKVEKDRQEAINQMNRLGSYYTVSQEVMAGQEPPTFDAMPRVGVPHPVRGNDGEGGGDTSGDTALAAQSGTGGVAAAHAPGTDSQAQVVQPSAPAPQHSTVTPDQVGTEIDSVAAPPVPPADPGSPQPSAAPAASGPTGPSGSVAPPAGFVNPGTARGLSKAAGISGTPRAAGRTGAGGRSGAAAGRVPGAAGRAGAAAGQAGGVGRAGSAAAGRVPNSMGRSGTAAGQAGAAGRQGAAAGRSSGITGRPSAAGQASGAVGRSGAAGQGAVGRAVSGASPRSPGRRDGVVGGMPNRSGASSASQPRIPRGTVVGGEQAPKGKGTTGSGGRSQAGVISGTGVPKGGSSARRPASGPGGIVGSPRAGTSAQGSGAREFTQGGAGLVRGEGSGGQAAGSVPRGGTPSPQEANREDSQRPDYLTEDEETWTTGRRGVVPPVIE